MTSPSIAEEYFSRISHLINGIESNLKKCSKKYRDKLEIDTLYSDLTTFLTNENVNDARFQEELQLIEKELRKSNKYNEHSRRRLNENKEKIRNLNIELKSLKTLLEKSSLNWGKFRETFELVAKWLDEQDCIKDLAKTDLNNYQRFQKYHAQFCESANFILQTSESNTAAKIKEKLLFLNKSWKNYQDRFKDTQYDQFLKYYECEQSLTMIMDRLTKIELLTQKQCKCNLGAVSKFQEELQKAFNDIECLDANLKLLDKLITRLDLRHDPSLQVNELYEGIRQSGAKLVQVRQMMPEFLRNLTKTCAQISSIEDGLQQIEYWVIDGEALVKSDPDQLNFDQIIKHIEKQKKHFNDYSYHENSIANKMNALQNLRTMTSPNFDYSDLSGKLLKIKELLINLNQRRARWEELFQAQQCLWRNFHQKTKLLEEWIMNAQKIVSEKGDDYNFLLHKHKAFFENVNEQLINDFLSAGKPLLQIKNDSDSADIKKLMDTLSGQWKMILTHAPIRLLKLKFKRLEIMLKQELKAADIEISEECLALNENVNLNEILRRHEAKFKHSNFFTTCESYLQELRTCTRELNEKKADDKSNVEEILDYLLGYWANLTKKIETMNTKLTILPDTKENFERNFDQFSAWLGDIEKNYESLNNNNLSSLSEYRRLAEKCQVALNELDTKQEQFAILTAQYDYLYEQKILGPEISSQLNQVKNRYLSIVEQAELSIQTRISFIEQVTELATESDVLANKIRNLSALSARRFMAEEDDNSIQTAIHEHHTVIDQMKLFEAEINNLKEQACKVSDNNLLHLPVCIYEKIVSTQDLIKQNLSEELDRQSSLMEIKKLTETKLNKMESLIQNVELIKNIMNTKTPEDLTTEIDLNTTSYEEEKMNSNHGDYSKYLLYLAKSKELVQASKNMISELKSPSSSLSGSASPDFNGFHEIREIELKIDMHSRDVESQIDIFEKNLAIHTKLANKMSKLSTDLESLNENFKMYELKLANQDLAGSNESTIENLKLESDKLRIDLDQINRVKSELNAFQYDRGEILKTNTHNLKHSQTGTLCYGFNEIINEMDLKKDAEFTKKLDQINSRIVELEEECLLKISDYKFQIEQFNMNSKQHKLNNLKSTLDLELDNLVNLKYFNNEEDLLIESEDILLDNGDDTQMDIIFNKTTEIDIDEEIFQDESNCMENMGCIDVRISRECLETNYNTSLDGESFNANNGKPLAESQLRCSREVLDGSLNKKTSARSSQKDLNLAVIHDTASDPHQNQRQHGSKYDLYMEVPIEVEPETSTLKKSVTFADIPMAFDLLETDRFERMMKPGQGSNSSEGSDAKFLMEMEEIEFEDLEKEGREIELESERVELERAEKEKSRLNSLRLEQERIEMERLEKEKAERRRVEWEELERERLEHEQAKKKIQERMEMERLHAEESRRKEELERTQLEAEELEKKSLEKELIEKEVKRKQREKERQRIEMEMAEREKEMTRQRLEKQRLENERFELERKEHERRIREKEEAELKRIETERLEMERAIKQREHDRMEMERLVKEKQRAEAERAEREQLEREEAAKKREAEEAEVRRREVEEREKAEKIQRELAQELERKEAERKERERLQQQEHDRLEKERLEREKLERMYEKQRLEKEILARKNQMLEKEKHLLEMERLERVRQNELERLQWEKVEMERIDWERQKIYEESKRQRELELLQNRLPVVTEEREEELERPRSILKNRSRGNSADSAYRVNYKSRDSSADSNCNKLEGRGSYKNLCDLNDSQNTKKIKIESDLKDLCDNFNYLKEKIIQIGELSQSDEETKLLLINLEKELLLLNTEVNDMSITCGLENGSCSGLDQATLTQFDLIKTFSTYLAQQLDEKNKQFNAQQTRQAQAHEYEINLSKYIELALRFYRSPNSNFDWLERDLGIVLDKVTEQTNYIESVSDLENRISSIESIEDSITNCFKQMCDMRENMSNNKLNRILIESTVLQPLSAHCADLKKFLTHWKQFDRDFNRLKSFLNIEIRVEHLLADGKANLGAELETKLKSSVVGASFLEKDAKKYSQLRDKLVAKITECEYLFSQGSGLFDESIGQKPCVLVPTAAKDFKEYRDIIKEACRYLDEKCTCFDYILKCQDKLKDFIQVLKDIHVEMNVIEDEGRMHILKPDTCLAKAKDSLEHLGQLKVKYKLVCEEKDQLAENIKLGMLGTSNYSKTSLGNPNLEAFNRKANAELRQKLETMLNEVSVRFVNLEVQYQEEIMKTLPSRSALNELVDWLRLRVDLVEQLSDRLDNCEQSNSIEQLDSYKKKLMEISDEMRHSRESSLKIIRNSIEDEIRQGFYDLAVSELLAKTERDWSKFKSKIVNDLERLDLSLARINEFDRNVKQMQVWIQKQSMSEEHIPTESTPNHSGNRSFLIDDMASLNIIDDDKKILIQISNYKELLSRLEVLWQQERNEFQHLENSKINQLVQNHMCTNLNELKANLQNMELASKLKIESNLTTLKQNYTIEINEMNAALEREVNFVDFGKIVSREQYETTVKKISELLKKLSDTRSKMQSILNKFDAELKSSKLDLSFSGKLNHQDVLSIAKNTIDSYDTTGLLENVVKNSKAFNLSSLHLETLERNAQKLVSQAQQSILPVWSKYDDAFQCLQAKINESMSSYMCDLESIEQTDVSNSNLYQDKLKEMMENRRLFEQFNNTSNYLIEKFAPNENTKSQLQMNKQSLQDQFDKLGVLADKLKTKFEYSLKEHQSFMKLINETDIINKEANKLLNSFAVDSTNKNKNLHAYIESFENYENRLRDTLDKFKHLNIKDAERISKIYESTNPSSSLLVKLRESRLTLLNSVQERHSLVHSKLEEVERYIENYQIKRRDESTLTPEAPASDNTFIQNHNLTKTINCIKFMLAHNITLSQYEKQLDELLAEGTSDESLYTRCRSIRNDKIIKFRRQIDMVSKSPDGLYDNLTGLYCLNEQLNSSLGQSLGNCKKHIEKFRSYNEKFHRLRSEIEKNIFDLQEQGLCFIEFRSMKANCLDPIESFYTRLVTDIESVNNKVERYHKLSGQLESALTDIETKLNNKITNHLTKLDDIIKKNNLINQMSENDFENVESRLNYLKSIKGYLSSVQLKSDIEVVQQLGAQLQQKGYAFDLVPKLNMDGTTQQQSNHEAIRIKYLDLTCRIDNEIKDLEQEFSKWKLIVSKSTKLLGLIRTTHEQLAKISLNSGKYDRVNSTEINSSFNTSNEILNGLDEFSSNSLEYRIEFKDNKTLSQLIDFLKFDVLCNLNEHELLKDEIVEINSRLSMKSCSIKSIVENVLTEWKLVNDKTNMKIVKLEKFKLSLNHLDCKLNKVREQIFGWEVYLNQECFANLDLVNYEAILVKKNELESLQEILRKKEAETQNLFKVCLAANRNNLNGNKQNQLLIMNIKERWNNLKLVVKEKGYLVQNLWILLSDLNDQMQNFFMVLEKTDTFYRSVVDVRNNNNPRIVFKLIQELYLTIQDDCKLIKYLNESFVNFSKIANYFAALELLNKMKEKFMALNNEWDNLHNEIAIKIKNSRKYENQMISESSCAGLTKEKISIWVSEIHLLITNLEYLSTNELKMKFNDVLELKKEVCQQTEHIFKNENILKDDEDMMERIKDIMKRIIRIDSYLQQQASSTSKVEVAPLLPPIHEKPQYMESFESMF